MKFIYITTSILFLNCLFLLGAPEPKMSVTNGSVTVKIAHSLGGAVNSLIFRGKQYINTFDHGRELQLALITNQLGECYNPTEGGGASDGAGHLPSSSKLLAYWVDGLVLATSAQVAFWLRPGETSPYGGDGKSCKAVNKTSLSPYIFHKKITLSFQDKPNVIEFLSQIDFPETVAQVQFEGPTGYLNYEFEVLYGLNLKTGELAIVEREYHEQQDPPVIATRDGRHAMGSFSPDLPEDKSISRYGSGYFDVKGNLPASTSKWTNIFRSGAQKAGTSKHYRSYIVVGTLREVKDTLLELSKKFANE